MGFSVISNVFSSPCAEARFSTKLGYYLASGTPIVTNSVGDVGLYLQDGINAFVAKKFNITDSTAGKVTTRLAQWYGGQDFKNSQLKDLKAWFDASNFSSLSFTSTIGSSQPINAWKDLSDNNNNVSQTNASNQPIWISGTANRGRPYLGFNGSTSCLFNNASGLISLPNESYTMFAVFESDITTHEEYGQVITGINKSDGTPIGGVNINPLATHGGGGTDSVSFYNKNTLTNLYENHISTAGVTDPKIIVGRKNGTALDIIDENGSTDTSTGINSTDGAYFTIGALVNSTIDAEFDGKIYEVIVVGESVSNTDRDKIIYYLKNKWNIL